MQSQTATTITVGSRWDVEPDGTSMFLVAESTWRFGAASNASPVSFVVPNRGGATIHVSGRAANVRDEETAFELSPLTRWRISGSSGAGVDNDVPGLPTFGLFVTGQGMVEVQAIGFANLANTKTISAGTFTFGYWDEVAGASPILLGAALDAATMTLTMASAVSAGVGDLIQVEQEIMVVQTAVSNGAAISVTRGGCGSTASAHAAQVGAYLLSRKTFIAPFAPDFFGSPASGSYSYQVAIPDVRIATAELFVTNERGNSDVARKSFTATADLGLRTLSGGQLSIQVEGPLVIQTNAAPLLIVENAHSVRDVSAVVKEAPTGAPIQLRVTQNGQPYCRLTIAAGATSSTIVDGFALGALATNAQIGLDITAVAQTADTTPGRDLTVTIRL